MRNLAADGRASEVTPERARDYLALVDAILFTMRQGGARPDPSAPNQRRRSAVHVEVLSPATTFYADRPARVPTRCPVRIPIRLPTESGIPACRRNSTMWPIWTFRWLPRLITHRAINDRCCAAGTAGAARLTT